MIGLAIARALHVLAIVVWIGGVAMVTLVLFPAIRRGAFGPDGPRVFQAIEGRFVRVARIATIAVALTGFYMVEELGAWDRFRSADFWWMHAMVCVWLIFTLLLFVIEPLFLHRWLRTKLSTEPRAGLALLNLVHWVLLLASLLTIRAAVAGSHGFSLGSGVQ